MNDSYYDRHQRAAMRLRVQRRVVAFAGWGNGVLLVYGMAGPEVHPMTYANLFACIVSFYLFVRCGDWMHYHLSRQD